MPQFYFFRCTIPHKTKKRECEKYIFRTPSSAGFYTGSLMHLRMTLLHFLKIGIHHVIIVFLACLAGTGTTGCT
jgi:hypothetical protein